MSLRIQPLIRAQVLGGETGYTLLDVSGSAAGERVWPDTWASVLNGDGDTPLLVLAA